MKIDWRLFILVADRFVADRAANGGLVGAEAMDISGIAATFIDPPAEE